MNRDLAGGIGLLALAALYYAGTRQIQSSSLSDDVGADGMPLVLATVLAGLAALLVLRGLRAGRAASGEGGARPRRALGFLAVAAVYMPAAWLLGYVGGLAVMIGAVALYEGARPGWQLAAVAIGGGAFFWVVFVQLLGVAQPHGVLF